MPEGIKCPHCGLVQYRSPDNLCKRCKIDLDTLPEVPPEPEIVEEVPPPRNKMEASAIVLMAMGGLCVLFLLYAMVSYKSWFHLEGGRVGHFLDSTELLEIDFPSGWHYLGLRSRMKNGKINVLGSNNQSVIESIRGSFFLGSKYSPKAIFYVRLQSLGVAGALNLSKTGQSLDNAGPQIIGAALQVALATQVTAAGGTYKALGISTEPLDRFSAVRCDGVIKTDNAILQWKSGGTYHVTVLYFKESTRLYWYFIFIPQDDYSTTWPDVRAVLDATKIHQGAF